MDHVVGDIRPLYFGLPGDVPHMLSVIAFSPVMSRDRFPHVTSAMQNSTANAINAAPTNVRSTQSGSNHREYNPVVQRPHTFGNETEEQLDREVVNLGRLDTTLVQAEGNLAEITGRFCRH